jgi:membrane protein DedA with SNARE-associated domain
MPDINQILDAHPYLAYLILLVWTFFEGETIVIIAGFAARDGNPWLPLVILFSFCGSLCSDQLMFFLGRYKGQKFIANRPKWQARAARVYRLLERNQTWLILGFRFLYGLRNVTPLAIGMSDVPTRRFILLNVIGAAVWATTFAFGGYVFGAAMETFMHKHQKWAFVLGILVATAAFWIMRVIGRRVSPKDEPAAAPQGEAAPKGSSQQAAGGSADRGIRTARDEADGQ